MTNIPVIVGLGNIGSKYDTTRHNIGFFIIDAFLNTLETSQNIVVTNISIKKIEGLLWKITDGTQSCILCKPLTYMNLSGNCVAPLLSYYSISSSSLLIIHDDLDLSFGTIRIKYGGGNAGHNGLRSLDAQLGTKDYTRLRFGIGRPQIKDYPIINWVLGKFTKEELSFIQTLCPLIFDYLQAFITGGFQKAQHEINKNK